MPQPSDVRSAHLNQSGYFVTPYYTRIKGFSARGTALASQIDLFSTTTAPVAATYAQSGNTITVTKTAHGLKTGQKIGISYNVGTGGAATCGNPAITVTGDNTFTITCINSYTITGNPACRYVADGDWILSMDLAANDTYNNYFQLPENGILVKKQLYAYLSNIGSATVFYG